MPIYHYLCCDSVGRVGSIYSAEWESDGAAHAGAAKMLHRQNVHTIEVWQGYRRIHHLVEER
jgi:hypothetical protein